jgi:hypothetical protein
MQMTLMQQRRQLLQQLVRMPMQAEPAAGRAAIAAAAAVACHFCSKQVLLQAALPCSRLLQLVTQEVWTV